MLTHLASKSLAKHEKILHEEVSESQKVKMNAKGS